MHTIIITWYKLMGSSKNTDGLNFRVHYMWGTNPDQFWFSWVITQGKGKSYMGFCARHGRSDIKSYE